MIRLSLLALVGLLELAACTKLANVQCDENSNCNLGAGGVCAVAPTGNHWCSYPDSACPSGYSYSTQATGDGVSGTCVAETIPSIDAGVDAPPPDAPITLTDWITRHGGSEDDTALGVAAAPNGDVVMTGTFKGSVTLGGPPIVSPGVFGAWVARYMSDGTHVWSVRLGDGDGVSSADVTVDKGGDVYVIGGFAGPTNFGGGIRTSSNGRFIVKISGATGAYVWDRVIESSFIGLYKIAAAGTNVAVCGEFRDSIDLGGGQRTAGGGLDDFIAVYDTKVGAHVWSKSLTTSGEDGGGCDLVGVDEDLILTGSFLGTAMLGGTALASLGDEDMFVVRYHGADGAHLWSMRQGAAGSLISPRSIVSDGTHVFIGGRFSNTTNLGGGNLVATAATSGRSTDAFIASYKATDGSHVWSERFGGPEENDIESLAANATKLAAAISFDGMITIGSSTFTSIGQNDDIAIARLSPITGTPGASALQFGSNAGVAISLAYTADGLAGAGTFAGSAKLLGTTLTSAGGTDIASFRVDF